MRKNILVAISTLAIALTLCFSISYQALAAETAQSIESISEEEALAIAIKAAGFSENVAKYPKVLEDGSIYKVVFTVGQVEFAYYIDMATGEIMDRQVND